MISFNEALLIHAILIEKFGGIKGLRDKNLLESSLVRPFQYFNKQELYPTPEEKAAAILESIITNHPFIDGNKRFGFVAMRLILMDYGKDINANEDEKYDFVIQVAKGEYRFKEVLDWIRDRSF